MHPGYGVLEVAGPVDSWLPAATDAAMEGCGGGEDETSDLLLFSFFSFPYAEAELFVAGLR